MDGARDQFLADAGCAEDKYGGISRRDHFDLLAYAVESGAGSQKFEVARSLSNLLAQIRILRLQVLSQPLEQLEPLADIAPIEDDTWRIGRILQPPANGLDV